MTAETIVGQADSSPAIATPVMSHHECGFRTGGVSPADMAHDPALMLNPAASLKALTAAAQSRANLLYSQLEEWTCVPVGCDTTAEKLATFLAPIAYEIETLLEAIRVKLAGKAAHHG